MRLFEFSDDDPLRVKLVAVTNQLRSSNKPITVGELMAVLDKNNIGIAKNDLFDLIKKEPLSNIIDKTEGDQVIFKGQAGSPDKEAPDEQAAVRQQMAKKALK
jgi:selenophosphate synthetase-related protein